MYQQFSSDFGFRADCYIIFIIYVVCGPIGMAKGALCWQPLYLKIFSWSIFGELHVDKMALFMEAALLSYNPNISYGPHWSCCYFQSQSRSCRGRQTPSLKAHWGDPEGAWLHPIRLVSGCQRTGSVHRFGDLCRWSRLPRSQTDSPHGSNFGGEQGLG